MSGTEEWKLTEVSQGDVHMPQMSGACLNGYAKRTTVRMHVSWEQEVSVRPVATAGPVSWLQVSPPDVLAAPADRGAGFAGMFPTTRAWNLGREHLARKRGYTPPCNFVGELLFCDRSKKKGDVPGDSCAQVAGDIASRT